MERLKRKQRELKKLDQLENEEEGQAESSDEKPKEKVKEKEKSTADKLSRQMLPYRKTSTNVRNREKSISSAKFDLSQKKIVYA